MTNERLFMIVDIMKKAMQSPWSAVEHAWGFEGDNLKIIGMYSFGIGEYLEMIYVIPDTTKLTEEKIKKKVHEIFYFMAQIAGVYRRLGMSRKIDDEVIYYLNHYRSILETTNPDLSEDDFIRYIVPEDLREKMRDFRDLFWEVALFHNLRRV